MLYCATTFCRQKISLGQAEKAIRNKGNKKFEAMAKVIDESLKKQLSKKMVHFLKYFPVRIKNVGEDAVAARNLIWAFKDSRDDAYEKVAQMTADHLQE